MIDLTLSASGKSDFHIKIDPNIITIERTNIKTKLNIFLNFKLIYINLNGKK